MADPAFQSDAFQSDAFQSTIWNGIKLKPVGISSTLEFGEVRVDDRTLKPSSIILDTQFGTPKLEGGDLKGSGTSGDPYQIWSFLDLDQIGTGIYGLNKYYKVMDDIDASPTSNPNYNSGEGWLPRGTVGSNFVGQLDGNGFTIYNLYINRPNTDYVGLFGYVNGDWSTPLKNISITGDITGQDYVGMVVGFVYYGNITDCEGLGIVTGRDNIGGIIGTYRHGHFNLLNPTFTGVINGRNNVGGIIGVLSDGNPATLDNSTQNVTVNISGNNGGCVCGYMGRGRGTIQNCKVLLGNTINASETSDNIGGVVGYAYFGNILNCFNEIEVEGRDYVGGIVGNHNYDNSINYCFNQGNITGRNYIAGIAGRAGAGGYKCPMVQNANMGIITSLGNYSGGILGWGCVGIVNNFNMGSIHGINNVGGLAGYCGESTVTNSYSKGLVIGTGNNIGGLIGMPDATPGHTTVTSSYWDIEESGQNSSALGTGLTTDQMTYPYDDLAYVGWDFTTVWVTIGDDQYPWLLIFPAPHFVSGIPSTLEFGENLKLNFNINLEGIEDIINIGTLRIKFEEKTITIEGIRNITGIGNFKVILFLLLQAVENIEGLGYDKLNFNINVDSIEEIINIGILNIGNIHATIKALGFLNTNEVGNFKVILFLLLQAVENIEGLGYDKLNFNINMGSIEDTNYFGLLNLIWEQFIKTNGTDSEIEFGLFLSYFWQWMEYAKFNIKQPKLLFNLQGGEMEVIIKSPVTSFQLQDSETTFQLKKPITTISIKQPQTEIVMKD